ncbi:MAG: LOG family protein [Chloroflexota bacterium]|nr:LOG family protein [Chloroflexota bacterium]
MKKISVFGGASPLPESQAYNDAYALGRLLGKNDLAVMTGGYYGTMGAISKGASEACVPVIGVTSDEIESYRPIAPNPWITEEWRCGTFKERLDRLVEECDAAVALPGGVGTLVEISLTWNHLILHTIDPKPLILVGDGWYHVMETMFTDLDDYIGIPSRDYLSFAPKPKDVISVLKTYSII